MRFTIFPLLLFFCQPLLGADTPSPVKAEIFHDWKVLVINQPHKICYIISSPKYSTPPHVKRGTIALLVTHNPEKGFFGEVSSYMGYPLDLKKDIMGVISDKTFSFIARDETIWAETVAMDKQLVSAMKKGNRFSITATSQRGTVTKDTYSLRGFTKAFDEMTKHCQ